MAASDNLHPKQFMSMSHGGAKNGPGLKSGSPAGEVTRGSGYAKGRDVKEGFHDNESFFSSGRIIYDVQHNF